MGRPKKAAEALGAQAELTQQFVCAVEAHCLTQAAAKDSQREPVTVRVGKVSAKEIERLLGITEPTGRTWNAYRRGDRTWPLSTLEQKIRVALRAGLLSREMASALQRKIQLVAIEDTQPTIDPIFEQSDSIVQHALALAEFHRKHNGAGYALDMLQPLLNYAEQIRAEVMLQAASMDSFNPMPPDIDI
ncbi:hypothetical protein [Burkholderia ambifaria]|uniref:hypothetical protein n=1 Tax=Burkholderia ambifaria TaxID=152480 RepID=UPI00158F445E|nr:hypothetical protein [Burkholderia ambifaria]